MVALVVGVIVSMFIMKSKMLTGKMGFYSPVFFKPDFSFAAIVSVSIPLVMMELADFLKGYGILRANKYDPPVNSMITSTGLLTMMVSFFLAHTITVAGPVTAITSGEDAGPKEHRWAGAFLKGSTLKLICEC